MGDLNAHGLRPVGCGGGLRRAGWRTEPRTRYPPAAVFVKPSSVSTTPARPRRVYPAGLVRMLRKSSNAPGLPWGCLRSLLQPAMQNHSDAAGLPGGVSRSLLVTGDTVATCVTIHRASRRNFEKLGEFSSRSLAPAGCALDPSPDFSPGPANQRQRAHTNPKRKRGRGQGQSSLALRVSVVVEKSGLLAFPLRPGISPPHSRRQSCNPRLRISDH